MSKSNRATHVSLFGAIVAAVAASACCLLPAVLALVGVSGLGLAAALEPYRPLLLVVTAVALAAGFVLVYRRPRVAVDTPATGDAAGADACGCAMPRTRRSGQTLLWIAAVLVVGFAAYPYAADALSSSSARGGAAESAGAATARVHISGMTCRACSGQVATSLAKVDGVIEAKVDYDAAVASVRYDPARASHTELVSAVEALGYRATMDAPFTTP